ncbi:outer membrane protein assembly factor BamE, partial [Falsiroseomonas oryzae]|uniref:outer membrane protein assembly factor BamE n=1 Tax=Falsiroseomonas oryzae TaxID=2766473 RepID=UPI0022EB4A59
GEDARPGGARPRRLALAAAALLGLGGCTLMPNLPPLPGADLFSSPPTYRGHAVVNEDLEQLTIGVSSRNDVQSLLGSPTASGTFDDSDWFYISSITRQRPGRALAVEDQQIVQIRFGGDGTVQEIRRLGPNDGRDIQVVSRVTPSPGNERTLMQQLFGNIGRVGPGLGAQQNAMPGAPGAR